MIKGIIPQTHLRKEAGKTLHREKKKLLKLLRITFEEKLLKRGRHTCPYFVSDLCSHGDVGYRGHASTRLWLFVLCSGLFKHLLPLTKRHNTPADETSSEV